MTTTNTEIKAETETEIKVDTGLMKLVAAYVRDEHKVQSHYLPLVEKALELFAQGLEQVQIMKQFRLAFLAANHVEEKEYEKNPEYVNFRARTSQIVNIAKLGPKWYEKQKKTGTGFYKMYEEHSKELTRRHEAEEDEPPTRKGSKGKEVEDKPEPQLPASAVADKQWYGKCRMIAKHDPDSFIKMIENLINKGLLPELVLEPISTHLKGE